MITSLTPEQEAAIPKYVDEYVKIGLSTGRINRQRARKYITRLYQFLGRQEPLAVVFAEGPVQAWLSTLMLQFIHTVTSNPSEAGTVVEASDRTSKKQDGNKKTKKAPQKKINLSKAGAQLKNYVMSQIGDKIGGQVNDHALNQFLAQISGSIGDEELNVHAPNQLLRNKPAVGLGQNIEQAASGQDESRGNGQGQMTGLASFVWPYLDGQFFAYWTCWRKYMEFIGVKTDCPDADIIDDQIHFGPIYPLESFCVVTEHPEEIHRRGTVIHKDGGPAIVYRDGTKIWMLNGVRIPQWLAETPAAKIDARDFAKIENAEIRREFIRKVGIERICRDLHTEVLDKDGDYELHVIDLGRRTGKWPYLKMLNPSIGVWHMECVGQECHTVKEALTWRNQTALKPDVLT